MGRSPVGPQVRALALPLLGLWLPAAVALAALVLQDRHTVDMFLRDPAAMSGLPWFAGAFSGAGVIGWIATAAVCLYAAIAAPRRPEYERWRAFALGAGLLSAILGMDDLFLFHEAGAKQIFGVHEIVILVGYFVATAWFLVDFRREILETEWLGLLAALGMFTLSVTLDKGQGRWGDGIPERLWSVGEDGAKLLGILAWAVYFVRTCRARLAPGTGDPAG